ncbi:MAG: hypothetical protein JST82_16850 [Bacteroidetes bacterium]|nr:hypothetical protein [Bacteroidota bacterium]
MKKLTLLLGVLMIAGATYACDGKKCGKDCKKGEKKECCKKDEKKACCKKDEKKEASAKKEDKKEASNEKKS